MTRITIDLEPEQIDLIIIIHNYNNEYLVDEIIQFADLNTKSIHKIKTTQN